MVGTAVVRGDAPVHRRHPVDSTMVHELPLLCGAVPRSARLGGRCRRAELGLDGIAMTNPAIPLRQRACRLATQAVGDAETWDACCIAALDAVIMNLSVALRTLPSGGEQKRVAPSRRRCGPDEVLLLDEPDNYPGCSAVAGGAVRRHQDCLPRQSRL